MKSHTLLTLAVVALPSLASAASPPTLDLAIALEPVLSAPAPYLKVELAYRAGARGTCHLQVPSSWGGQDNMMRSVRKLEVDGATGPLQETAAGMRSFPCVEGKPLRVRYELHQDFEGQVDNARRYRFVMQPEYFHFNGNSGWVLPAGDNAESHLRVDLRWKQVPAGWRLVNSYGVDQLRQQFDTTRDGLESSSFAGGDFRLQSVGPAGKAITVAMRGNWAFTDAQFIDSVRANIALQRAFWKAGDTPFLVTLIPMAGRGSIGGTGLTDAFQMYGTADANFADLDGLVAHEYFHTWNPGRLGGLEKPEELNYWMSEGFTDYYATQLRLRAGRITLEQYVAEINAALRATWFSSARNVPNAQIQQDFWKNAAVYRLPYQRGHLLALEWNAQIREASKGKQSFDDVIYELERQANAQAAPLNAARFDAVLRRYAGKSAMDAIARHIEQGVLTAPRAAWLGPGMRVEEVELPVFELGFDLKAIRDLRLGPVAPESAAYRAGLREGQLLKTKLSFALGKPDQVVEMTVEDAAGTKTVRFEPKASKGKVVPQFRLPDGLSAEGRAAIMRWLGA
ncbi:MAG TPA: hypothetical protein VIT92_14785 [Burkholderiaceae bacterium]